MVDLEFREISLTLKSNRKKVLSGCSGHFPKASLVALMGPSGGGKTTFMNALLGRASYGVVGGEIKLNGQVADLSDMSSVVGFVPQDDVMHANLTVYENLIYSAELRLPASTAADTRLSHVGDVIKTLGLNHVRDSVVGSAEARGISGGQKKRVNIGMELVAMPAVVFMDEPTSGLDGSATLQLAESLTELQKSGLLTICVIHQPRVAVFNAFSHLLLLGAGGQTVYCGLTRGVKPYLTSVGFRMPDDESVADWIIDVVSNLSARHHSDGTVDESFTAPQDLFDIWENDQKPHIFDPACVHTAGYRLPPGLTRPNAVPLKPRRVRGVLMQAIILLDRSFHQHDMTTFVVLMSLLWSAGFVFSYMMASGNDYNYIDLAMWLKGGNMGAHIFAILIAIYARQTFASERLESFRELKSGVSAIGYWSARILYNTALIPFLTAAYATAVYFTTPAMQSFGYFYLTHLMYAWAWSGIAMAVSLLVASSMASTLVVIFMPFVDMILKGTIILNTWARDEPASFITAGRWYQQALFAAEVHALPYQIAGYIPIHVLLEGWDMDPDHLVVPDNVAIDENRLRDDFGLTQEQRLNQLKVFHGQVMDRFNDGLINMLIIGVVCHLIPLVCLIYLKYSYKLTQCATQAEKGLKRTLPRVEALGRCVIKPIAAEAKKLLYLFDPSSGSMFNPMNSGGAVDNEAAAMATHFGDRKMPSDKSKSAKSAGSIKDALRAYRDGVRLHIRRSGGRKNGEPSKMSA